VVLTLGDALRRYSSSLQIQECASRVLAEQLDVERAFYVDIDEGEGCAQVLRDFARAPAASLAGEYRVVDFPWTVALLRHGSPCWIDDTQDSPAIDAAHQGACAALRIVAWMGAPVIKEGRLVGALCVADAQPRRWTADEAWILQEAREKFWYTLARARAEEALRERSQLLERQAQQLRWLASELTLAEHRTREQLSKTLHDHLQQLLFSASLTLQGVIDRAPGDALLARAQSEVAEAMAAARALSLDIFPPVLRNEGLAGALAWLGRRSAEKLALRIRVEVDELADPAEDDARILLFESVRELLFNAAKHADAQEVTVRGELVGDELVRVEVADDGHGFDPEAALDRTRDAAGLGLFSIGERLSFLGGDLKIDSAPGRGACFTMTVPRSRLARRAVASGLAASAGAPSPPVPAAAPPTCGRRLRVLLADDHAMCRDGLRGLLSVHPELEVIAEAQDGLEAVQLAEHLQPDVVVMDVSMPVLDGVAATQRLRVELPHVQVYGLSSQESFGQHPIEKAGARGYFSKGDAARDLVGRLLAEHRARAAAPA
jgi:signal transduction histidine kinase